MSDHLMTLADDYYSREPSDFEIWLHELYEVTKKELADAGISRDVKINESEAKKCFDSGMSPWQTFRENYEM